MTLADSLRALPAELPQIGDLVKVRSRRWLVEDLPGADEAGGSSIVRLACADDDNQGQVIDVYWEYEPDRQVLREEGWEDLGQKGFDPPREFAAFLNTLEWNCVTATDTNLFQAPFRAGIKIDAYQMEPLRKALQLPRVNLFIADDTGLGKTIEAGLIARELLLRKKAKIIVVVAPPSVLEQWKAELEERFGLLFEILDRRYLTEVRRERGFGVNPWRTHSRFLVSQRLLIDPAYAAPLREWLGQLLPGSLLILDEAHHAAPPVAAATASRPSSPAPCATCRRGSSTGCSSPPRPTTATPTASRHCWSCSIRTLHAWRPVRGKRALEDVMVRRLKEDIRQVQGGFPERQVVPIVIDGLPGDAPELRLSKLLDDYRCARATPRRRARSGLSAAAGLRSSACSSVCSPRSRPLRALSGPPRDGGTPVVEVRCRSPDRCNARGGRAAGRRTRGGQRPGRLV